MELLSNFSEKKSFKTRPKIEEHMLIVMNKPTQEEHLFQSVQINIKQFELVELFLCVCTGVFKTTNKKYKFSFTYSIQDNDFSQTTIPPGVYEIESVNDEIKRIFIKKESVSSERYRFTKKPNFITIKSFIGTSSHRGTQISFVQDDSLGSLLGFNPEVLYEKYNLSPHLVDIISIANIFIGSDCARGTFFECKRTGIIHNFTIEVNPRLKFSDRFSGL